MAGDFGKHHLCRFARKSSDLDSSSSASHSSCSVLVEQELLEAEKEERRRKRQEAKERAAAEAAREDDGEDAEDEEDEPADEAPEAPAAEADEDPDVPRHAFSGAPLILMEAQCRVCRRFLNPACAAADSHHGIFMLPAPQAQQRAKSAITTKRGQKMNLLNQGILWS